MLSRENRNHEDFYAFRNGMRNIAYVSGWATKVTTRGGFIQQTSNLNQLIPFELEGSATMPGWVREGEVVKIVARVTGRMVSREGGAPGVANQYRETVLKVLSFELPSVLEMPPEEAWARSVPARAPSSDMLAKDGQFGLPFTKGSNIVKIAGFVSGKILRKGGNLMPNGKRSAPSLLLHLRQTKNPDEAIPVRVYSKYVEALDDKVKLGAPIYIQAGEARIDAKETGAMLEGYIADVTKVLFIKSANVFVANRDHIKQQPDWAIELALAGRALNMKSSTAEAVARGLQAERPALKVVHKDDDSTGEIELISQTLDEDESAAVAAAAAELGGGASKPTSVA